jgi:hypothetical protein
MPPWLTRARSIHITFRCMTFVASGLPRGVRHASAGITAATIFAMSLVAPRLAEADAPTRVQAPQGIVWTGTDATVSVEELALRAAPILWFSPDEPLLFIDPTAPRIPGARQVQTAPVLARPRNR